MQKIQVLVEISIHNQVQCKFNSKYPALNVLYMDFKFNNKFASISQNGLALLQEESQLNTTRTISTTR